MDIFYKLILTSHRKEGLRKQIHGNIILEDDVGGGSFYLSTVRLILERGRDQDLSL